MNFEFCEIAFPSYWYPVTKGQFSARDIRKMLEGHFVKKGAFRFRIY